MKNFPIGNPIRASHERGGILVIAIIVILAMLILAIPFLFKLSGQWRTTEKASHSLAAFNLAEAGVDKVLWDMNMSPYTPYDPSKDPERINWNLDDTGGTINNIQASGSTLIGNIDFTLAPDPDPGGTAPVTRLLESRGRVPFINPNDPNRWIPKVVDVMLEKYFTSIWDYGFFVDDRLYPMDNKMLIDSVDSRLTMPLNQQPSGQMGYFGVNSYYEDGSFEAKNITVTGAVAAGGDLLTEDPPRTPDPDLLDKVIKITGGNNTITKMTMESPFMMPSVNVLDLYPKPWSDPADIGNWFNSLFTDGSATPASGNINSGFLKNAHTVNGTETFTSANNGVYTSLEINGTLKISGNVMLYVTGLADGAAGHLYLGDAKNSGAIEIEDGGSLTLILGETSVFEGNGSSINIDQSGVPGKPADCIILGTDSFMPNPYLSDFPKQSKPGEIPTGVWFSQHQAGTSAAIYIPRAQVFNNGQGGNHEYIYGALISYSMAFKTQTDLHYDEALGELMIIKGGYPKWKVQSWHEKLGDHP